MAESADEGGDNGESDRGIIVQHTNRLIMNTYKKCGFLQTQHVSAWRSCVCEGCTPKEKSKCL